MKIRHCAALLIALLAVSLLAGCFATVAEHSLEEAGEPVEKKTEQVLLSAPAALPEEEVPLAPEPEPIAVQVIPEAVRETAAIPEAPPETTVPAVPETVPPAKAEPAQKLTVEQAKAIALEHGGFRAEEVRFLRAEYDIDDRVPQYDIEFDVGRWEYEYEIHAETGKILSWEKDD